MARLPGRHVLSARGMRSQWLPRSRPHLGSQKAGSNVQTRVDRKRLYCVTYSRAARDRRFFWGARKRTRRARGGRADAGPGDSRDSGSWGCRGA
eukprot:scaffold128693_cov68-Phaeocystis_antarctica.AAC.12